MRVQEPCDFGLRPRLFVFVVLIEKARESRFERDGRFCRGANAENFLRVDSLRFGPGFRQGDLIVFSYCAPKIITRSSTGLEAFRVG